MRRGGVELWGGLAANLIVSLGPTSTAKAQEAGETDQLDAMRPELGIHSPLERFAINKDADGYVVVDMTKVYRSESGEWDNPESFVSLG